MLGPRPGESKAVVYKIFCKGQLFALKLGGSTSGSATTSASNEISVLSQLNHLHIVQLAGSYKRHVDKQHLEVGIILYPAAQCNLEEFLREATDCPEERIKDVLRTFFGCLSGTVDVLHKGNVKHKDIKPQNILVKRDIVFFSDFAISRHFGEGMSKTNGPSRQTRRYSAPEVAKSDNRGRAADIFSLSCVFLEMISVIGRQTVTDLLEHLDDEKKRTYHENPVKVLDWIERKLDGELCPPDSDLLHVIVKMLDHKPEARPLAGDLIRTFGSLGNYRCGICHPQSA